MPIKLYTLKNGLTLTAFAEMLGYSRDYISALANGNIKMGGPIAKKIEKVTNGEITISELMAIPYRGRNAHDIENNRIVAV
jgi:transcriptional regulator with XRE-family HTH domain